VEDRVHDPAVLEDHDDAPREAHDQRGAHHVAAPRYKGLRQPVRALACDDPRGEAHGHEEPGDLLDVPTPEDNPGHHAGHSQAQDQEAHPVAPGELGHLSLLSGELLAALPIQVKHGAPGRIPADTGRVDHDPRYRGARGQRPDQHPVAHAGQGLDPCNPLGDLEGERVDEGPREAHPRGQEGQADPDDGVIAQGQGQGDEDQREGHGLLAHAEDRAEEREQGHYDGYDQELPSLQDLHQAVDPRRYRPCLVQHVERAAHQEDERDDLRKLEESLDRRGEDLEDLRLRRDGPVGALHDQDALGLAHGLGAALVCPAGDEPRGRRGQDDQGEDDEEDVGDALQGASPLGDPRPRTVFGTTSVSEIISTSAASLKKQKRTDRILRR